MTTGGAASATGVGAEFLKSDPIQFRNYKNGTTFVFFSYEEKMAMADHTPFMPESHGAGPSVSIF